MSAYHQSVRFLVALMVVASWMAIGWLLRLDPNSYLLVGVPITVLFQLSVARKSLVELWLRSTSPIQLNRWVYGLWVVFAGPPLYCMVAGWHSLHLPEKVWFLAAIVGAFPLALCLVNANRRVWKSVLECLLTAGLLGAGIILSIAYSVHGGKFSHNFGWIFVSSFFLYLPVCFMIEEVFFRGCLDSFVQREGDEHYWESAFFISILWALWHLPLLPLGKRLLVVAVTIVIVVIISAPICCVYGLPLSVTWRRSGSLLGPAIVHAFLDSVRNAGM